jgi:hypothetical protein
LVYCIVPNKTKKFSEGRSNRDVKVCIHEIEACCPHTRVDARPDGTIGVSEVTSTVRDSHLFVSHIRQREANSSVGGSSVFDLERSNREGSGSFSIARFLLPSFLSSQENWGYETSYKSVVIFSH